MNRGDKVEIGKLKVSDQFKLLPVNNSFLYIVEKVEDGIVDFRLTGAPYENFCSVPPEMRIEFVSGPSGRGL